MKQKVAILPSLLAGNFGRLEESALKAQAAGGDALHLDIMDGHFVPNLTMGPDVVRMAHSCLRIPLSVHLMLTRPDYLVDAFIEAGSATLLIHAEAQCDVAKTLRRIREKGIRPGLALNPETPAAALDPYWGAFDEVLCMTVHPGFGGQAFMPEVLPKLSEIFTRARQGRGEESVVDLGVDGGIDLETVKQAAGAGANIIIAGSSLFKAADMSQALAAMRTAAEQSWTVADDS
ncbi:MAG: ribulose-phosphate 3-epimerase [Verrucomicrobia bacterium]|nr:ribulose-phosphate 3-epimerase [Verrucomicrobiota bacterium]MBU4291411.1 ribulose-phosphate 3-epimerase [Verrucomicrobiota bacterium]MBU4429029.1 ribulose-phosphate 3-epimerase [Verrucomicrobiota bacterium]MCG2680300.1 ribulose-phosphate 3-epimerase [Kiritimatiellia bacterium]